jgi:hypothetical protein
MEAPVPCVNQTLMWSPAFNSLDFRQRKQTQPRGPVAACGGLARANPTVHPPEHVIFDKMYHPEAVWHQLQSIFFGMRLG